MTATDTDLVCHVCGHGMTAHHYADPIECRRCPGHVYAPPPAERPVTAPDVATTCDRCGASIGWGARCYLVPSGERLDGQPVVTVECDGRQVDP